MSAKFWVLDCLSHLTHVTVILKQLISTFLLMFFGHPFSFSADVIYGGSPTTRASGDALPWERRGAAEGTKVKGVSEMAARAWR